MYTQESVQRVANFKVLLKKTEQKFQNTYIKGQKSRKLPFPLMLPAISTHHCHVVSGFCSLFQMVTDNPPKARVLGPSTSLTSDLSLFFFKE
jgi:hypothetical protein